MEAPTVQPRLIVVNLYVLQMINFHIWKLYFDPYRSIVLNIVKDYQIW